MVQPLEHHIPNHSQHFNSSPGGTSAGGAGGGATFCRSNWESCALLMACGSLQPAVLQLPSRSSAWENWAETGGRWLKVTKTTGCSSDQELHYASLETCWWFQGESAQVSLQALFFSSPMWVSPKPLLSVQADQLFFELGTWQRNFPKVGSFSISGWWLGHPSEKYEFVNWDDSKPNIWENKTWQPNHQPDFLIYLLDFVFITLGKDSVMQMILHHFFFEKAMTLEWPALVISLRRDMVPFRASSCQLSPMAFLRSQWGTSRHMTPSFGTNLCGSKNRAQLEHWLHPSKTFTEFPGILVGILVGFPRILAIPTVP